MSPGSPSGPGEFVLVTGAAVTGNPIDLPNTLASFGSITGIILLWLIYFSRAESGGRRFITRPVNPSHVAADGYTYLQVILVGGIAPQAAADEFLFAGPLAESSALIIVPIYSAPIVYLAGNLVFKRSIGAPWLVSHTVGAIARDARRGWTDHRPCAAGAHTGGQARAHRHQHRQPSLRSRALRWSPRRCSPPNSAEPVSARCQGSDSDHDRAGRGGLGGKRSARGLQQPRRLQQQ